MGEENANFTVAELEWTEESAAGFSGDEKQKLRALLALFEGPFREKFNNLGQRISDLDVERLIEQRLHAFGSVIDNQLEKSMRDLRSEIDKKIQAKSFVARSEIDDSLIDGSVIDTKIVQAIDDLRADFEAKLSGSVIDVNKVLDTFRLTKDAKFDTFQEMINVLGEKVKEVDDNLAKLQEKVLSTDQKLICEQVSALKSSVITLSTGFEEIKEESARLPAILENRFKGCQAQIDDVLNKFQRFSADVAGAGRSQNENVERSETTVMQVFGSGIDNGSASQLVTGGGGATPSSTQPQHTPQIPGSNGGQMVTDFVPRRTEGDSVIGFSGMNNGQLVMSHSEPTSGQFRAYNGQIVPNNGQSGTYNGRSEPNNGQLGTYNGRTGPVGFRPSHTELHTPNRNSLPRPENDCPPRQVINAARTSPMFEEGNFLVDLKKSLSTTACTPDSSRSSDFVLKLMKAPRPFAKVEPNSKDHRSCHEWLFKLENFMSLQKIPLEECPLIVMNSLEGDILDFILSRESTIREDYYELVNALMDYCDSHADDRAKRKEIDAIYMNSSESFESFVARVRSAAFRLHGRNNPAAVYEVLRNAVTLRSTRPIMDFIAKEESMVFRTFTIEEMVMKVRGFEAYTATRSDVYKDRPSNYSGQPRGRGGYSGSSRGSATVGAPRDDRLNTNPTQKPKSSPGVTCFKCGKPGHKADVCYSTQNLDPRQDTGRSTQSTKSVCDNCGKIGHSAKSCFLNLTSQQKKEKQEEFRKQKAESQAKTWRDSSAKTIQHGHEPERVEEEIVNMLLSDLSVETVVGSDRRPLNSTPGIFMDISQQRFQSKHPGLDLSALKREKPESRLTQLILRTVPHMYCTIDGLRKLSFLDTGASSSLISDAVFQEILKTKSKEWIAQHVVNVKVHLTGYDAKQKISISELVSLELSLGERTKRALFLVDKDSTSQKILIGWSAISQFMGNVFPRDLEFVAGVDDLPYSESLPFKGTVESPEADIMQGTAHIAGQICDAQQIEDMNTPRIICMVAHPCHIEPNASQVIRCVTSSNVGLETQLKNGVVLLEPKPGITCALSDSIVRIEDNGEFSVAVDNLSALRLEFEVGEEVGTLELAEKLSVGEALSGMCEVPLDPGISQCIHEDTWIVEETPLKSLESSNNLPPEFVSSIDGNALSLALSELGNSCSTFHLTEDVEIDTNEAVEMLFLEENLTIKHNVERDSVLALSSTAELATVAERKRELRRQLDGNVPKERPDMEELYDFLVSHQDVFSLSETDIGYCDLFPHEIDTGVSKPFRLPCRRTAFAYRQPLEDIFDEYLQKGIIVPSISPYASPIVIVKKKNGKIRVCIDFRELNKLTVKNAWPQNRMDDLFDSLGHIRAKIFSTLDLRSGYLQCLVKQEDRHKTAFVCHRGLFEFCRLPFGLCNAPATFSRVMTHVLQGLPQDKVCHYLDDVLISTETIEEHKAILALVFERFRIAGLRLNPEKCEFFRTEISFLGFCLTEEGIKVDEAKVSAIQTIPVPTGVKGVRRFLGSAGHMRRFIPNFASLANALFQLLKKGVKFTWSEKCQKGFDALKHALTTAPVLVFPDFTKPFILETDASSFGFGAVLCQYKLDKRRPQPIAYASRSIRGPEANYAATHLEAAGVMWAIDHFRAYLTGHKVVIATDHSALTSILNCKNPTPKLHRWILRLQEYDLEFVYKPGAANKMADALSRTDEPENSPERVRCIYGHIVEEPVISAVDENEPVDLEAKALLQVAHAQRQDPFIRLLIDYIDNGELPDDRALMRKILALSPCLFIDKGVVYYQGPKDRAERVLVPIGNYRSELIYEAHSSSWAGHFSGRNTYLKIAKQYYWVLMRKDIQKYVDSCVRCAIRQGQGRKPKPELKSIVVEPQPFFCVGMDLCKYARNPHTDCSYALVIQDYFTKYPMVYALKDIKACTVAECFVDFVSLFGAPRHVITDQGSQFVSALMQEVFELLQTTHLKTTVYHPQTDGLVERYNRSMQQMLAKVMEIKGQEWDKYLPHILAAYRQLPHSSTGETPHFMLFGWDPVPLSDSIFALALPSVRMEGDDFVVNTRKRLQLIWDLALEKISAAQLKQREQYNKTSRPHKFNVGDRVWRYLPRFLTHKDRKTSNPYIGPYIVTAVFPNYVEIRPPKQFAQHEPVKVSASQLSPTSKLIDHDVFWDGKKFLKPKKKIEIDKEIDDTVNDDQGLNRDIVETQGEAHNNKGTPKNSSESEKSDRVKKGKTDLSGDKVGVSLGLKGKAAKQQRRAAKIAQLPQPAFVTPKIVPPHARLCMTCHKRPCECVNSINSILLNFDFESENDCQKENFVNSGIENNHFDFLIDLTLNDMCIGLCIDTDLTYCRDLLCWRVLDYDTNIWLMFLHFVGLCTATTTAVHTAHYCKEYFLLLVAPLLKNAVIMSEQLRLTAHTHSFVKPIGDLAIKCKIVKEKALENKSLDLNEATEPILFVRECFRPNETTAFGKLVLKIEEAVKRGQVNFHQVLPSSLFAFRFGYALFHKPVLPAGVIFVPNYDCLGVVCELLWDAIRIMQYSRSYFVVSVELARFGDLPLVDRSMLFYSDTVTDDTLVVVGIKIQTPYFLPVVINLLNIMPECSVSVEVKGGKEDKYKSFYGFPENLLKILNTGVVLFMGGTEEKDALLTTYGINVQTPENLVVNVSVLQKTGVIYDVLGKVNFCFNISDWAPPNTDMQDIVCNEFCLPKLVHMLGMSENTKFLLENVVNGPTDFARLLFMGGHVTIGLTFAGLAVNKWFEIKHLNDQECEFPRCMRELLALTLSCPADWPVYNPHFPELYWQYRDHILAKTQPIMMETDLNSVPQTKHMNILMNDFSLTLFGRFCVELGSVGACVAILAVVQDLYMKGYFPKVPGFEYKFSPQWDLSATETFEKLFKHASWSGSLSAKATTNNEHDVKLCAMMDMSAMRESLELVQMNVCASVPMPVAPTGNPTLKSVVQLPDFMFKMPSHSQSRSPPRDSSGSSHRSFPSKRGYGSSRGQGRRGSFSNTQRRQSECFYCHKYGHVAANCWKKRDDDHKNRAQKVVNRGRNSAREESSQQLATLQQQVELLQRQCSTGVQQVVPQPPPVQARALVQPQVPPVQYVYMQPPTPMPVEPPRMQLVYAQPPPAQYGMTAPSTSLDVGQALQVLASHFASKTE